MIDKSLLVLKTNEKNERLRMPLGKIKMIKDDKGFGFIERNGQPDLFFHASACNGQFDSLRVGQEVSYEERSGEKGPRAENVRPA